MLGAPSMILRTVFVKLEDSLCTPEERRAFAAHSQTVLASIPGVVSAECGPAADPASEASWDVTLQVRFADMDAVEVYRVHPIHLAYLEDYLVPKSVFKKVWNFQI